MNLNLNFKNIKENIITLNLVLLVVGYQFMTSILVPLTGGGETVSTQIVTIPYRVFSLGLSILSIAIGIQNWQKAPKFNALSLLLIVFLLLYGLRIIYDQANGIPGGTPRVIQLYFLTLLPYIISLLFTYESINYRKALIWMCILGNIAILLSMLTGQKDLSENARMNGNAALRTISYGHLGVITFILTISTLFKFKFKLSNVMKTLLCIFILLDLYTSLRAGSRGPMAALIILGFLWIASIYKNLFIAIYPSVIVFVLLLFFKEQILDIIHAISPVAANRFNSLLDGNSSGRDSIYLEALSQVADNPIAGIGYLTNRGQSHNMILDALIAFGILGGFVMTFILYRITMLVYKALVVKHELSWIGLLTIQQMSVHMFSSTTFYAWKFFGLSIISIMIFSNIRENGAYRNPQHMPPRPMPPLIPRQNFRRINPHR